MAAVLLGGLMGMIALARSGSVLFFRTLPATRMADEPATNPEGCRATPAPSPPAPLPAGEGSVLPVAAALVPVVGLLLLGLAMTVFAGPIQAHVTSIAEQLSQPYFYVHAVLGGRI